MNSTENKEISMTRNEIKVTVLEARAYTYMDREGQEDRNTSEILI
jgi:hypothetical protein